MICPTPHIVDGSVAPQDDLKAFAVERQLSPTRGLGISVRSYFNPIKFVSGRFEDENGKTFLTERVSHRKRIALTR